MIVQEFLSNNRHTVRQKAMHMSPPCIVHGWAQKSIRMPYSTHISILGLLLILSVHAIKNICLCHCKLSVKPISTEKLNNGWRDGWVT